MLKRIRAHLTGLEKEARLNPDSEVERQIEANHVAFSIGGSNFGEVGGGQYRR
jgi:hypothetical protein